MRRKCVAMQVENSCDSQMCSILVLMSTTIWCSWITKIDFIIKNYGHLKKFNGKEKFDSHSFISSQGTKYECLIEDLDMALKISFQRLYDRVVKDSIWMCLKKIMSPQKFSDLLMYGLQWDTKYKERVMSLSKFKMWWILWEHVTPWLLHEKKPFPIALTAPFVCVICCD
jgi:hypothetical protein